MHAAIINRPSDPLSLQLYEKNICRELSALGVEMTLIQEHESPPDSCDILWDPGMCMRRFPSILSETDVPVVCTMHGVKAFSMEVSELVTGLAEQNALFELKTNLAEDWRWFRHIVKRVIAVSDFAKEEVIQAFNLPANLVTVIHHGLNQRIFHPNGACRTTGRPYFLHVSRMDPVKNLSRILEAYSILPEDDRPEFLFLVTPEEDQPIFTEKFGHLLKQPGVTWVRDAISQEKLASWYRGALALIVPSLRETFGLPIIEAMACGCPVVTSNGTGCAEVAGSASIQVDPHSTKMIADAMWDIFKKPDLREQLRLSGLSRSKDFAWERSARRLVRVFNSVLTDEQKRFPSMRKLEITTAAPCHLECTFCPHEVFQRNYLSMGRKEMMDWETFHISLMKLPLDVGISFGGMSEPFLNSLCTNMILEAKSRGHTIEIFTTLVGLTADKLRKLIDALSLGYTQDKDRIFIHLPSVEGYEKIPVTREYLSCLEHLAISDCKVAFHYHGSRIADSISNIKFDGRLKYWPLHNRATNETQILRKTKRKTGHIACVMNAEVNTLLPNGEVCLCCQDFGIEHVLGNLIIEDANNLYQSSAFKNILKGWQDDRIDIPCRYCSFSIERDRSEKLSRV